MEDYLKLATKIKNGMKEMLSSVFMEIYGVKDLGHGL